ncbi:MAG: hypothetical protein QOJ50_2380 [Cryptosporangiaceae bacterium]|jgi:hypothetical protein|nr:hypothetical protein [Cryptosporangiaceae bacterium]
MGLFSRMRTGSATTSADAPTTHAVIARYQLAGGPTGTATDIHNVFALEQMLAEAIDTARVGEFAGNDFGGNELTVYAQGPDADRLFAAMEPVLRAFPPRPAQVVLQYGDSYAPHAVVQL